MCTSHFACRIVLQSGVAEANHHSPESVFRVDKLVAAADGGAANFDLGLRRRRVRQVRRRHDEDPTKFVQDVSQLPSESKLRERRRKVQVAEERSGIGNRINARLFAPISKISVESAHYDSLRPSTLSR